MYRRPSWLVRRVETRLMRFAVGRLGRDLDGVQVLEVPGRRTGQARRTPVKVLDTEAGLFLVSLRGDADWVRNLRANPAARLRLGQRITDVLATELSLDARVPLLREYLRRATRPATRRLLACPPDRAEADWFRELASEHSVFRLTPAG